MARKTYRTFYLKGLDIHFKDENGKHRDIIFQGGIQIDSTARFTTTDEYLQQKLESLSGFGRDYYIEKVQEDEAPKVEEKEPVKEEKVLPKEYIDAKKFKNLVEMKDALIAAGLKIENSWNYTQTKKFAFEHGYDYQVSRAEN